MSEINVKLITNADPAVTCEPNPFHVNNGNHDVTWKHGGNEDFTFESIDGLPDSIFTTPQADDPAHPDWFICSDNNQQPGTYSYTVWVLGSDGKSYSTQKTEAGGGEGDPMIENK